MECDANTLLVVSSGRLQSAERAAKRHFRVYEFVTSCHRAPVEVFRCSDPYRCTVSPAVAHVNPLVATHVHARPPLTRSGRAANCKRSYITQRARTCQLTPTPPPTAATTAEPTAAPTAAPILPASRDLCQRRYPTQLGRCIGRLELIEHAKSFAEARKIARETIAEDEAIDAALNAFEIALEAIGAA